MRAHDPAVMNIQIVKNPLAFRLYGATDAAIILLAVQGDLVLTEDGPLTSEIMRVNGAVANLNHLRGF